MIPFEQAAGDSGKEKLSSDRKKSPAEPDSGRKAICCDWLGGWGKGKGYKGVKQGAHCSLGLLQLN